MGGDPVVLTTLIVYQVVLLGLGWWAQRRTHDSADYLLGGRGLGPWVAALSASASSSSAWSLLGVSGAAYLWGLSAIWLLPATLLGFIINWVWVAPRLMQASRDRNALTLVAFVGLQGTAAWQRRIQILGALIVLFSFTFYVAAQFQAAGTAFLSALDIPADVAIILGASVVLLYVLLGGFWAVSVTDALQGLLMAATAVVLPIACLFAVGPTALIEHLSGAAGAWVQGAGIAGVGFVIGLLGIGLGYPGQPHVVNRFMALKDQRSLRQGRVLAITWAGILYTGMLITGWSARMLFSDLDNGEQALLVASAELLPPIIAGVMIAAVLSAIMSTADSQLHVAGSAVSHDLRGAGRATLGVTRWTVAGVTLAALTLALFAPQDIFSRVLFAWHALGSALGPALILALCGRRWHGGWLFASILVGFCGTVVLHLFPNTPGDIAERYVPLLAAGAIAWLTSHPANRPR